MYLQFITHVLVIAADHIHNRLVCEAIAICIAIQKTASYSGLHSTCMEIFRVDLYDSKSDPQLGVS